MVAVLEVKERGFRFGGLVALVEVMVWVGEWEIVGVFGPYGAG